MNLARWRGLSNACKLCGQRQSLLHILNNCSVALKNRRYNQRHDLVLSEIHKFLTSFLNGYSVISDLANSDTYHIPSTLTFTDLRPDLVIFSKTKKHVALIELTIPFETNFEKAQERKLAKYLELAEDIERKGFDVDLITVEVGSRGFVSMGGFLELKDLFLIPRKEMEKLLGNVSKAAITGSHHIIMDKS